MKKNKPIQPLKRSAPTPMRIRTQVRSGTIQVSDADFGNAAGAP